MKTLGRISVVAAVLAAACGGGESHRKAQPVDGADAGRVSDSGAPGKPDAGKPPVKVPDASDPVPEAGPDVSVPEASAEAAAPEAAAPDAGLVGLFVDPSGGVDTNAGTQAAPFKTIAAAAKAAKAGDTIYLADGIYDPTNQPDLGVIFPKGVTLRGVHATGAEIHSTSINNGFMFTDSGGVHDVVFDTFQQVLSLGGTGTFDMSGVQFKNVGIPVFAKGTMKVTIDATGTAPFVSSSVSTGFGVSVVVADEASDVTFTGGTISNVPVRGAGLFFARGTAKLRVEGTTVDTSNMRVLTLFDNANVVLKDVTVHNLTAFTGGMEGNAIVMGGQNSAQPKVASLRLENTDISSNQVGGIGLSLYSNFPTTPVIELVDSNISGNTGNGIVVLTPGFMDPASVVTITSTNTTFKNNKAAGITADFGTITLTGGEVSGNGTDGIALTGAGFANSLRVRGTTFNANTANAIAFAGTATSVLDLGTAPSAGGLTFTLVPAGGAAVNLTAPIAGTAIGNTWMPNVQGAGAAGTFAAATTIAANATGMNFKTGAGATLVVR